MKIEAKHLFAQPDGESETHQISLSNLELSDDTTANISGTATLTAFDDFILASVTAQADISLPCHRCLESATIHMDLDFSSQFYDPSTPSIDKGMLGEAGRSFHQKAKTGGLDDEDGYPVTDNQIDLVTPITDEIIASLPIKVLCQDACLGLCPVCGNNLNDNPCKCDKVEFEVLNKIRLDNGSSAKTEN